MPKYQTRTVPGTQEHGHLAAAIVRAWNDRSYKQELLTFPDGWEGMSRQQRDERIDRTRKALQQEGVSLNKPVVLRTDQFPNYEMEAPDEIVFVLPAEPPSGSKTETEAKNAMNVVALGV
jgi:hypothetical protein